MRRIILGNMWDGQREVKNIYSVVLDYTEIYILEIRKSSDDKHLALPPEENGPCPEKSQYLERRWGILS